MKHLFTTLILLSTSFCCLAQTDRNIFGTWVLYKMTVNNQELTYDSVSMPFDTLIIASKTFEQRLWTNINEKVFNQSGTMNIKKDRIILTERSTSESAKYGPAPDIYYNFKLKNREFIIIGNGTLTEQKIENNQLWSHYRKLRIDK